MADRYLKESSGVDGYLKEDGSGVLLLEAAAGSSISKTATDAVTFGDSTIRVVILGRIATDASGQTDVATRALVLGRTAALAAGFADVATVQKGPNRSAADALGAADVATRTLGLARSTADARGQADVATRLAVLARAVADARGQSDAVTSSRSFGRTAADARGQSDAAVRAMILARMAADALAGADVAVRVALLARSVVDARGQADVAVRGIAINRSASDARGQADMATRTMILARTIAQALGFADVATRQLNRLRSTSDHLTISDAAVAAAFRALRRLKLITYHALVYSPDANGGPGTPKLELDPDLLNLVWQQNQNLAGQAAFALTRKSTKIDQIEWMVDHIKVFRESSSGVRTMFAGKLVKPIYSAVDILCYAWDYLAFLQLSISGYKTLYPTKKIGSEVVSPEWVLAKGVSNSPFTFVTTGTIQDPLGLDGTTFIKTNANFGVTLFDRLFIFYTLAEMAMANTTNNVKFEITRESPHTFNFWKNYGAARVDYAGVFPGNLMDYDFDAGKEHERLDLFTVLSDGLGGQVSYEVATSDVATSTLRRLQAAVPIRTLFGVSSGTTETDQAKAALARQLIVSTRYPRAVRVRPRQGEIDLFNGHDLGDTFRHTFQKADRSGDQYDGYLRLVGVAGSWAAQHGEMIDLYLRGAS